MESRHAREYRQLNRGSNSVSRVARCSCHDIGPIESGAIFLPAAFVKPKNSFRALFSGLERRPAHSAQVKAQADLRVAPTFLKSGRLPYLVRLAQDGRILDVNTAGLAAFAGASRRAVVGSSIYAYLPEEHRDAMSSLIRNGRPDTASINVEFEMVAPDGGGRCTMKARTAQLIQAEGGPSIR